MDGHITWSPGVTLEAIEKETILKAFRFYRGNKTATANALGIAIRTLDNKLERYELDAKEAEKGLNDVRAKELEYQKRARGIETTVQAGTPNKSAPQGVRVEPVTQDSAQQPVPMPQREKVQEMPQRHAAGSGNKRGR